MKIHFGMEMEWKSSKEKRLALQNQAKIQKIAKIDDFHSELQKHTRYIYINMVILRVI